ncbi:FtsX-like permease family protein [Streptomyces sp. NPDC056638]|uniref:ABC transporter permease n=1 Tax=Streptomyces sp. NPDC056638 TaxID=3345887 RepID=UPI0036CB4F9A
MSAVWHASRAAVKRRRVQTIVIGLVVLCSTMTIVLALSVLNAASSPFDDAFARQRGAHVVATFDAARASPEQLAQTAQRQGVQAAAGPFGQVVIEIPQPWLWMAAGPLQVVGRADPAGPVDRVDLLAGRWATAPGEIVVNSPVGGASSRLLGSKLKVPGVSPLTVVGFATSMSKSAGAWVSPEQMTALHPTSFQMLYRFASAGTSGQIRSELDAVTAGQPASSLTNAQSYLSLKEAFSASADSYLPFMTMFGVLGLLVSVLIVGNVVSGAVVSGYRHIGVLKALGFTPNQVVAVYLGMISVPTVVGSVVGTLAGTVLEQPILKVAFAGIETGTATIETTPWVSLVCLLAMPAVVAIAALIPALRAHRLSAAEAISAGSAPKAGRGLLAQRKLGSTRLPRSVSLGLGQSFARPARATLTMSAVVLGVMTVTLTTGLASSMVAAGNAGRHSGITQVAVEVGDTTAGQSAARPSDSQIEARLRALPGADRVTARAFTKVLLAGNTDTVFLNLYRGDPPAAAEQIVEGRWPSGPGEVAAGPGFLAQHGLAVGDRTTVYLSGRQLGVTVVGKEMLGNAQAMETDWATAAALAPDTSAIEYTVQLAPNTDGQAYAKRVEGIDPSLRTSLRIQPQNTATTTVVTFTTVFTVLLACVSALGVFNTVLLSTRERRRQLGMLKSIGMTPRQVMVMTVTSVAGLGLVGGLIGIPIGIIGHRVLVDHAGVLAFPESMKDVWHAPQLAALVLSGVAIAVLGALIPARSAARLSIATVLHNE